VLGDILFYIKLEYISKAQLKFKFKSNIKGQLRQLYLRYNNVLFERICPIHISRNHTQLDILRIHNVKSYVSTYRSWKLTNHINF